MNAINLLEGSLMRAKEIPSLQIIMTEKRYTNHEEREKVVAMKKHNEQEIEDCRNEIKKKQGRSSLICVSLRCM